MTDGVNTLLLIAAAGAWLGIVIAVLAFLHRSERSHRRQEAREHAELALLAAEHALPGMGDRLGRALAALEAEGPLPAWCVGAVSSARQEAERARNELQDTAGRIRALLGPESPGAAPAIVEWGHRTLAACAKDVKAVLARHDAQLALIERTKAEILKIRKEALLATEAARRFTRGLLKEANAWHTEGWPVRGLRRTLLKHCRQAGALLGQARNPAADHRQAITQAQAVQAEALGAVDAARKKFHQARNTGSYPVPVHPLFELCRRQDVIVHEGRCYLAGPEGITEGPLLEALERRYRSQGWTRGVKERIISKGLDAVPLAGLTQVEQLVKFALDEVFPHLRIAGESQPAVPQELMNAEVSRTIFDESIARLNEAAAKNAPRAITQAAQGEAVTRVIGAGSIRIRKDGGIDALVPSEAGTVVIDGKRYHPLQTAVQTDDQLADAISYWTRHELRIEALQEAFAQGALVLPADTQLVRAITAAKQYIEGDHRLEVKGNGVDIYLKVPEFALHRLTEEAYHAFPETEVTSRLTLYTNGQVSGTQPVRVPGPPHPFVRDGGFICRWNGDTPPGDLPRGAYIAAFLLLMRDVLRTGYNRNNVRKIPDYEILSGPTYSGTVMTKAELDRRGIPVTNI